MIKPFFINFINIADLLTFVFLVFIIPYNLYNIIYGDGNAYMIFFILTFFTALSLSFNLLIRFRYIYSKKFESLSIKYVYIKKSEYICVFNFKGIKQYLSLCMHYKNSKFISNEYFKFFEQIATFDYHDIMADEIHHSLSMEYFIKNNKVIKISISTPIDTENYNTSMILDDNITDIYNSINYPSILKLRTSISIISGASESLYKDKTIKNKLLTKDYINYLKSNNTKVNNVLLSYHLERLDPIKYKLEIRSLDKR